MGWRNDKLRWVSLRAERSNLIDEEVDCHGQKPCPRNDTSPFAPVYRPCAEVDRQVSVFVICFRHHVEIPRFTTLRALCRNDRWAGGTTSFVGCPLLRYPHPNLLPSGRRMLTPLCSGRSVNRELLSTHLRMRTGGSTPKCLYFTAAFHLLLDKISGCG